MWYFCSHQTETRFIFVVMILWGFGDARLPAVLDLCGRQGLVAVKIVMGSNQFRVWARRAEETANWVLWLLSVDNRAEELPAWSQPLKFVDFFVILCDGRRDLCGGAGDAVGGRV
eukprot:GABV01009105.1.p1 GENE.GABV01009105.1~~GABV01009105.1.p1  ORF type:complete len:115 (+),score=10.57 GABV01009105.1:296-640(+)